MGIMVSEYEPQLVEIIEHKGTFKTLIGVILEYPEREE